MDEVLKAFVEKGCDKDQLPAERTMQDLLNRMNYRLKRIQKGKPLKKNEDTDAIFANVHAARDQYRDDPQTLEISVDNGPKNSGVRTQFLKRMVEFADWSGLEIHLVYYPPYHSKYNPIERCWSSLQKKWNGVLLTCWETVEACALRMKWKGLHPTVMRIEGEYPTGIIVPKDEMEQINQRLERSETPGRYDIVIRSKRLRGR